MGKIIYSVKSVYDNKEWGRTLKTSVVLAIVMLVGLTPFLSYANSLVVNKTTLNLKGERVSTEDYIRLEWDKPDQEEPYTYQVYSKKPNSGEYQSISSSNLDTQKIVKALNVFPVNYTNTQGSNYIPIKETGGKDLAGKPLYNSAMLEEWVGEYGHGRIEVDSINQNDFNDNPDKWLKDSGGNYQYDVVAVGFWNINAGQNSYLGDNGIDALRTFAESGRGLLTGHHHIGLRELDKGMNKLRDLFGIKLIGEDGWNQWEDTYVNNPVVMDYTSPEKTTTPHGSRYWATGDEVVAKRRGLLLEYPNYVAEEGRVFDIPLTHNGGDYVTGDVWLEFTSGDSYLKGTKLVDPPMLPDGTKGTTNSYLSTYNNTAFIQAGHSSLTGGKLYSTEDEKKLIANTIFYLAQLTTDTNLTDRSAMDSYPPTFLSKDSTVTRVNGNALIDFPDAKEEDSLHEYYVEATGQNTGKKVISETIKVSNTSGFSGYSYVVDDKEGTVPDNKVELTDSKLQIPVVTGKNRYVHVVAVDKKGNISEPLHIKVDGTPPELELFLGTTEWINSEVVINYTAKDSDSGLYKVQYSTGGTEHISGKHLVKSFRVNENGVYSITLEDKMGNKTTKTIEVTNIDKDKPTLKIDYTKGRWTKDNVKVTARGEDTASGIKNVRMSTESNSKNLITMADLQGYSLDTYEEDGLQMYFKSKGESKFGGVQIPQEFIEEDEWHVLSFDITKLEGNITRIGGHGFIESETYVYIDGKLISSGEGNIWTESVPYPNDNEKHHVTVVFLAGDFGENANDNLYIQPNRNFIGTEQSYEAIVENVQLERGDKETPYEPNYKDLLEDVNPLQLDISENGDYTFTVTDNAGNEHSETITISNIDKGSPIVTTDYLSNGWTKEDIMVNATFRDELTGVAGVVLPDNTFHGVNNIAPTDIEFWEYGHYHGAVDMHQTYNWDTLPGRIRTNKERFLPLNGATELEVRMDEGYYLALYYYTDANGESYIKDTRELYATNGMVVKLPEGAKYTRISVYRKDWDKGTSIPVTQASLDDIGLELTPNVKKETITIPFKATKNGEYVLKAKDTVGNITTKRVEVTNIDKTAPTLKVSGNPQEYTEEEEVTLQIEAVDTESGVRSITLPDGKVINGNKGSYKVNDNGTYEVILIDNLGHTSKHQIKVDKIMVPYMFYLMDAKGKPIKGAGFNLLRNGVVYSNAISDDTGLVNFGKVPEDGVYKMVQTKAPDGYIIDPTEKEVEVGDTTEPEEYISYPRGKILPATGTVSYITYLGLVLLTIVGWVTVRLVHKNKRIAP